MGVLEQHDRGGAKETGDKFDVEGEGKRSQR